MGSFSTAGFYRRAIWRSQNTGAAVSDFWNINLCVTDIPMCYRYTMKKGTNALKCLFNCSYMCSVLYLLWFINIIRPLQKICHDTVPVRFLHTKKSDLPLCWLRTVKHLLLNLEMKNLCLYLQNCTFYALNLYLLRLGLSYILVFSIVQEGRCRSKMLRMTLLTYLPVFYYVLDFEVYWI